MRASYCVVARFGRAGGSGCGSGATPAAGWAGYGSKSESKASPSIPLP